jgi:hypothetical protein
MSAPTRAVTRSLAVDLFARAVAIAVIAVLIFVGLPFLAGHAG